MSDSDGPPMDESPSETTTDDWWDAKRIATAADHAIITMALQILARLLSQKSNHFERGPRYPKHIRNAMLDRIRELIARYDHSASQSED